MLWSVTCVCGCVGVGVVWSTVGNDRTTVVVLWSTVRTGKAPAVDGIVNKNELHQVNNNKKQKRGRRMTRPTNWNLDDVIAYNQSLCFTTIVPSALVYVASSGWKGVSRQAVVGRASVGKQWLEGRQSASSGWKGVSRQAVVGRASVGKQWLEGRQSASSGWKGVSQQAVVGRASVASTKTQSKTWALHETVSS